MQQTINTWLERHLVFYIKTSFFVLGFISIPPVWHNSDHVHIINNVIIWYLEAACIKSGPCVCSLNTTPELENILLLLRRFPFGLKPF